jgi:glycosyltransferase involved in cell wall biosynthesis
LIKAFYFFAKKHSGFELVLAGRIAKDLIDPYKIIAELNLQNKIRLIGYITEEEKSVLYKYAKAFVFVSTHEGFGFPILEAQSLGVPVLTSNTSSLPEIAGDGALFVNPFDIEEISKGMEKIVFDENLRKDLIQKGYENIKRFSWRKSAEELLEIFKEVKSS